jgi:hypothetical protein
LSVAQERSLIGLHHADVSASNQGHCNDHLNQSKPPVTGKAGCMGLWYWWVQSACLWFLHAPILRGCRANFYQTIRLLFRKSAVDLPLLSPALKIRAYAYIFRHFSRPARQPLLDPGDHC